MGVETDIEVRKVGRRVSTEKREAVIEAALVEFAMFGYSGAKMDGIARRAGVGKPTLYRWYGSKEKLLNLIVEELYVDIGGELTRLFSRDGSVEELLFSYAKAIIERHFDRRNIDLFVLVISESRRMPEVAMKFYNSGYRQIIKPLEEYFVRLVRCNIFREIDCKMSARGFADFVTRGVDFLFIRSPSIQVDYDSIKAAIDIFVMGCMNSSSITAVLESPRSEALAHVDIERENATLKRLLAEAMVENAHLKTRHSVSVDSECGEAVPNRLGSGSG